MRLAKIMFKTLATLLIVTVLFSISLTASDRINVTVDGRVVEFSDQEPVIVNDSTLVPIRGVFEEMGFDVDWDYDARANILTRPGYTVVIALDSEVFIVNNESRTLEVPAQIINDRSMLPIRPVLESVGYNLEWESATRTVVITSGDVVDSQIRNHNWGRGTLWWENPRFANNTDVSNHSLASNGALNWAIRNFYRQNLNRMQGDYRPAIAGPGGRMGFAAINRNLNDALKTALRQGWEQDTYTDLFPMSQAYFDLLIRDIDFQLTRAPSDLYNVGMLWSGQQRDIMFVPTDLGEDMFVQVMLHELFNAMTLGDPRADLAGELLMGRNYSIRGDPTFRIEHNNRFITYSPQFHTDSTFSRTLLSRLKVRDGADGAREFWAAAFGQNQDIGNLWNREMSEFISFEDLQWGVTVAENVWRIRPELASAFHMRMGMGKYYVSASLVSDWRIIHNESCPIRGRINSSAAERASAQLRLTNTLSQMRQFAQIHNLEFYESGYDWHIQRRHERALR